MALEVKGLGALLYILVVVVGPLACSFLEFLLDLCERESMET